MKQFLWFGDWEFGNYSGGIYKMPKVSIIIVSFNVRSYLVSAIDSILKSNYSNYEIIVVDNNSYDNTVDIIYDKYPKVNIISNDKNVGFGKAVNQGAKIAIGDYFLILNPDTIIEESMINDLIEYIESNKKIGMVGPKILNSDGSLQLSCKRSFSKKLSSFLFLPLGLVPAIGLIVILLFLNLTRISGLAPIIWKSVKLKKYINGDGFVFLSFL